MSLKISGADDLITIEGDINAEFLAEEETQYLVLSDGTIVSANFDQDRWAFDLLNNEETTTYSVEEATDETPSSILILEDLYDWVAFAKEIQYDGKQVRRYTRRKCLRT